MVMPEKLKGETLLKVVTIIVIVLGAITIALGAISYLSSSFTMSMFGLGENIGRIYSLIGGVTAISGIVIIVVGILGLKWRKDIEYSAAIIVIAIVQAISSFVCGSITANLNAAIQQPLTDAIVASMPEMQGIMESELVTSSTAISLPVDPTTLVCIVLSVLMIIGAILNKNTKPVAVEPVLYQNQ